MPSHVAERTNRFFKVMPPSDVVSKSWGNAPSFLRIVVLGFVVPVDPEISEILQGVQVQDGRNLHVFFKTVNVPHVHWAGADVEVG